MANEYVPLTDEKRKELVNKFSHAINSVSAENGSDTPDFHLASYLVDCLEAFNRVTIKRDTWYDFKTLSNPERP